MTWGKKERSSGTTANMPDYQQIFYENRDSSLKTLIAMYQGKYMQLVLSVLFFVIKHSPVWVMPIVTAHVLDAITNGQGDAPRVILFNMALMLIFVLQNVPTNYIHTYFYAKAIRQVEMELRSALVRRLQQLSVDFHRKTESGRIQSKIMRDVEQIETLSAQIFINLLSIECGDRGNRGGHEQPGRISVFCCDYSAGGRCHRPFSGKDSRV